MREEWYVVPARYAFKLREVVDPVDPVESVDPEPEDDALLEGMHAESLDSDDSDESGHTPPLPRHLPRTSRGHLKR